MVYKNQGCQVIRPDSVNLLDLNDYNISGDLRCLTWMHHKQLLDVMHFKMIPVSDTITPYYLRISITYFPT